jgi:hypothetical protein
MAAQVASDDNLKTGGAALADSSIRPGSLYCSLTVREKGINTHDPLDHRNGGHKNYAINLGCSSVVRKTKSVIVFVVGQSQERRICGHSNVCITRLSLAMIVAPAAGNLKFPVKFPVSREFDVAARH